jgi:hypothetical protein
MSSLVLHGCCALAVVAAAGCAPHTGGDAKHPIAEARNAEGMKKPGKRRPLVAPPPAYGNKIVLEHASGQEPSDTACVAL